MGLSTKQALLQALSEAEGRYISGQQLAEQLGVSRAAVHKAAAALTAQGYTLEAVSRRGYRLLGGDPFCAEALGDYPAPVHLYETLESSNQTAKQLALSGAPHGTLVLTGQQAAGRGRMGRKFESPAGKGVYLSLILRADISAADAQAVTVSAAVAVCRAVKKLCGLELSIKWVNDLYYHGKKVCGILTEAGADLESGRLEWLVVGIGLNLTAARGFSRGAAPHRRQSFSGRPLSGQPGRTGRCHRKRAAGPLPSVRLSGRVPVALFCSRPLGDRLHRERNSCRPRPFHRRRRSSGHPARKWPDRSPPPWRSEHPTNQNRVNGEGTRHAETLLRSSYNSTASRTLTPSASRALRTAAA